MKVKLISLNPGDKYIDSLGRVATILTIDKQAYSCVDGWDYHCAKGEKFNYTIAKRYDWQDADDTDCVYDLSDWAETEVELVETVEPGETPIIDNAVVSNENGDFVVESASIIEFVSFGGGLYTGKVKLLFVDSLGNECAVIFRGEPIKLDAIKKVLP